MFSEEFLEKIQKGKYSRWAAYLTEDHLFALLWAVGEYGCRSSVPLELLRKNSHFDPFFQARAVLALEVLADFTRGQFISFGEYCTKTQEARASAEEAWKRMNKPPASPAT